jgi:predicted amidohydrolase YtcJ
LPFSNALQRRIAIIADRDIFEIDPHTISDTNVMTTIVGGKIVYEADAK